LHISGKVAIVGFVLFIIGLVWKLILGIPLGIWVTPPENLVVEWWTITLIHKGTKNWITNSSKENDYYHYSDFNSSVRHRSEAFLGIHFPVDDCS